MTVPATGLPDNWNVAGKALTGFDITNAEGSGVTIDRRDSTASGLQFSEHEPFTIVREGNTQTYIQTP